MVETINELHAKLHFHSFANMDVFPQTKIHVVDCVNSQLTEPERQGAEVIRGGSTVYVSSGKRSASRIAANY